MLTMGEDDPDINKIPTYFTLSWSQSIKYYSLLPFLFFYQVYSTAFRSNDKSNALKRKGISLSGKKQMVTKQDFKICDLNDLG